MHRYWKYTFPEEFNYTLEGDEDHFKARNILRAMRITDNQLSKLKNFSDTYGYTLMIASSMGQEAIERGPYNGELRITDVDQFYKGLGYEGAVQNNLAMQPDFAFSFKNDKDRLHFKSLITSLRTPDDQPLFTIKEAGATLNCNLKASLETLEKKFIYKGNLPLTLDHFGLTLIERDPGTGYHQPKGIWTIYQKGLKPLPYREKVESIQIAPTILDLFDIKRPSYMKKPLPLKKAILEVSSPLKERELDFETGT
jgi:predicted AlkP superfamily phosphohydrolase/phosphomutase